MANITLENFAGIAPKIRPAKLADELATESANVRLSSGAIEAWRELSVGETVAANILTAFKYLGSWVTSTNRQSVVSGLIPNDVHDRIFYSDADYPKVRSGADIYRLGLPRPSAPVPSITTAGDSTNITDVRNQRYVVTLVDGFGVEGPSSLPTDAYEVGLGGEVTLDLTPCTVTGAYKLGGADGGFYRIYRTNTGDYGTVYQYVGQVAYGSASFVDDVAPGELQEALLSAEWVAAPDDDGVLYPDGPLQGLIKAGDNVLAGFSGNTVFFSEPGVPTAWPYYYSAGATVVGLVKIQSGILVVTTGKPYLLVGDDPSVMTDVPIESDQSCTSGPSLVDMGASAIYASPDGLVLVEGATAVLITGEFIDRDTWQGYDPTSMRGYKYEGRYLCFYGNAGLGFVVDVNGGTAAISPISGIDAYAGWNDTESDTLYLAHGTNLGIFDGGADAEFSWQSKDFIFPSPRSFSCGRIQGLAVDVNLTIYADGVTRGPYPISSTQEFRLPGGYEATTWRVKVEGTGAVDGIYLSESMSDLP